MNFKILIIILVCLFCFLGFAKNNPLDNIDKYINELLTDFQVPGLSIAVIQNGEIIFAEGFGKRESGKSDHVDKNTIFPIASISKSTVALSLAMLVDEKKLNWDDPVIKYLPEFQMYDSWVTREITIRDLLTHRSGLASISGGTLWYGSDYTREEIIERIRYLKPVSSFRSKYAYQNIMYLVAGQIIKAVSGKTWDEFVNERIFIPLGMKNSSTTFEQLIINENTAKPHILVDGKLMAINYRNHDNIGPAGSINASTIDLAKYMLLFLNKGKGENSQLINEIQMNKIFSPQMILPIFNFPSGIEFANPTFRAYGLGWFIMDYRGHKVVYHSGGVDGFRCLVTMIPEKEIGIVVLINQEERRIFTTLTYKLFDVYLGFPEFDWKSYYLHDLKKQNIKRKKSREDRINQRIINTQPSLKPEKYCGTYRDRMYGDLKIYLADNQLKLSFSHTPSFKADLEHWHYNTYKIDWYDPVISEGLVTFVLDGNGKVSELKFDQPNLLDVDFGELNLIHIDN